MLNKIMSLCLGVCCLFVCSQADALEYDKRAIMKEFKCKAGIDTVGYAFNNIREAVSYENWIFENETVKIEAFISLMFDNLMINGATRKSLANSTIILPIGGNPMLGFNTGVLVAPCLAFNITNKTDEPIEFDLDHSQITIGSYQGRGVQSGTKYNGAATSVQAPVMIFPKSSKEVRLWRTDHNFYQGFYYQGQALIPSKWIPPFDVTPDRNLLGDMILCLNKKYITFSPKATIQRNKMKWIKP